MSSPGDGAGRVPTAARLVRFVSMGVVAASIASLAVAALWSPAPAQAAGDDSSVTVRWTDASVAGVAQPPRDAASPHYDDFRNLSVTVSQTSSLIDQAVRVSFSGFSGGSTAATNVTGSWNTAMNFMQAMQCWGDPDSADFRNTCQWGGKYGPNNGLVNVVYDDNLLRVSGADLSPTATDAVDVPFTTSGGQSVSGRMQQVPGAGLTYPLFSITSPATTNEVVAGRVRGDGTGYFDFEAQTADQAPQLGCGREQHLECYLVLVPRGTHFGGTTAKCSRILDASFDPYTYGRADSIQAGSPLNPGCDYWNNRIVVPLDFTPVGQTCPAGSPEQRVAGSQLLVGAMASWQQALCTKASATFSFATNPDAIARLQLLDGQTDLAFGSRPIVKSELQDAVGESEFDTTLVSYAPVAIGGVSFAYFAEGPGGRIDQLRLTPRLVAKLLTQSYTFQVPFTSAEPTDNLAHLPEVNRQYSHWRLDPDVQAVNPNASDFTVDPALLLPGPAGADAIRQVWAWVLSDPEARAWLGGEPDEWGMTVNPYYLPAGHPDAFVPEYGTDGLPVLGADGQPAMKAVGLRNADGTPMSLSTSTLDYFLKADETEVPFRLTIESRRFDSLQAFPYSDNFLTGARDAFRADPHSKTVWDPSKATDAGTGDWVSVGPQNLGSRFMIAVTDVASARRYALDTAELRLPSGAWTTADTTSMLAALAAAKPIANVTSFVQVDPAAVTGTAYPLTTIVYAVTNLTTSTPASRIRIAKFLQFVATDGQSPGVEIGDLPDGYAPLTGDLSARTVTAAAAIFGYAPPTPQPTPSNSGSSGSGSDAGGQLPTEAEPTPSAPEITDVPVAEASRTPATQPVGRIALIGSLGLGLAGVFVGPALLRGRRTP